MNVVVLPSARYTDAAANLERFVEKGRASSAFGDHVDWDASVWKDVKLSSEKRATAGRTGSKDLHFLTGQGGLRGATDVSPLEPPFSDFVKALLRQRQDARPKHVEDHRVMLRACRLLHDELRPQGYDPCLLLPRHFDAAAKTAKAAQTASTAYSTGKFLAEISKWVDEYGIGRVRVGWRNTIPRPTTDERFGKEADERRAMKLPSDAALDALPKLANLVQGDPDLLRMRVVELLACGGFRINELLSLPADCEVEEPAYEKGRPVVDASGRQIRRFGIRYSAEKGFGPTVKWIPTSMIDVAKRAIVDILRITAPVRADAAWIVANPDRVNLPGLDAGEADGLLTMTEIRDALGLKGQGSQWCETHGVKTSKDAIGYRSLARRGDVCAAILADMPRVPVSSPIPLERHLFLIRDNFVHAQRGTIGGSVRLLTDQMISDFLIGGEGRQSVFARYGFTEPDGSPIGLTSHAFRHWLNTLAQEGGLSQELVARWSGRKDMSQNSAYDHVSGKKLADKLREIAERGGMRGRMADVADRMPPVDRSTFLQTQITTAHVTDIGFCVHDWSLAPCPNHGDCANCDEHVVDKGNAAHKAEAERQLREVEHVLAIAEKEVEDDTYGASRWRDAHSRQRDSLIKIVAIHQDDTIPGRALVHLGRRPSASS